MRIDAQHGIGDVISPYVEMTTLCSTIKFGIWILKIVFFF